MLRVRYLLAFKPKSVWTIGPEEPVLEAIQVMSFDTSATRRMFSTRSASVKPRSLLSP